MVNRSRSLLRKRIRRLWTLPHLSRMLHRNRRPVLGPVLEGIFRPKPVLQATAPANPMPAWEEPVEIEPEVQKSKAALWIGIALAAAAGFGAVWVSWPW